MKVYLALGTVLLACSSMLAQSSAPAQSTEHSTGMPSNMQMGSAEKSKGMSGMKHHEQMHDEVPMAGRGPVPGAKAGRRKWCACRCTLPTWHAV